jgi:superoxide dismutase, Fe-Mn family
MKTSRRNFLQKAALLGTGSLLASAASGANGFQNIFSEAEPDNAFTLPPLPYAYDALEPFIDKQTMEVHHTKHHQAYVNNLNKALGEMQWNKTADKNALESICRNISEYNTAIRNNAGGHYNHSLFWTLMKPGAGGSPSGALAEAIKGRYASLENLKKFFSDSAKGIFGSGWTWLIVNMADKKLEITTTPNQDNPLMDVAEVRGFPILGLDIWEHAYYLKYQNKRPDYIAAWWNVVNWDEASRLYSLAIK